VLKSGLAIHILLSGLFLTGNLAQAQQSDCASISRRGTEVILTANSWDPVLAIGETLSDTYGVNVSVESPKWDFPNEAEDVTLADPQYSHEHPTAHYMVIKPHTLEVRFNATGGRINPNDVLSVLRQLVDVANTEMPYAYRLDVNAEDFVIVPTRGKSSTGAMDDVQPLLDRRVTIPPAMRPIYEHGRLLAEQLSKESGLHVGCCQSMVSGIPWGGAKVFYGANDKPAREVLRALIQLNQESSTARSPRPYFDHWVVRCDGTGSPWCFIDVASTFGNRCR
jgi:hypothetical protein